MSKEAIKLALEALDGSIAITMAKIALRNKAITALREALANEALDRMAENAKELGLDYTLTQTGVGIGKPVSDHRMMEQPAQQEPVAWTVQRRYDDGTPHPCRSLQWAGRNEEDDFPIGTKFYTSSPVEASPLAQRKPLTDEEIWREYRFLWPFHPEEERKLASDILMFARAIEAKLKEKNNG